MGGAPQGQLADWGQRVIATLIDIALVAAVGIVIFIVGAILGAVVDVLGTLVFAVGYLVWIALAFYVAYLNGAKGQSPGKALTGLKVIGEQDSQVIGGGMGIVRYLAHIVDSIICYIGYLFPLWDEKRQTLADKIIKTVVVTGAPKQSFGPEIFQP